MLTGPYIILAHQRLFRAALTLALLVCAAVAAADQTPLQQALTVQLAASDAKSLDRERLERFYSARAWQLVWVDTAGPLPRAVQWKEVLFRAREEGLQPEEYHDSAIRRRWNSLDTKDLAALELLLTDAFFRYAVEVRAGYQYPRAVDVEWYITPSRVDPVAILESALRSDNLDTALRALPPPHAGYRRLKDALKRYRDMARQGEWGRVPPGPNLRLGSWNPQVVALRRRLIREGYLNDETPRYTYLFDRAVEDAVRRFQYNYGHKVDGIVGYYTRRSLNGSLARRIDQIKRNMERWRWLPRNLGERYVMVNMAGYKLYVVEHDQTALAMRVIIGKPFRATPAFRDRVEYLEINPAWNVPPRIAREELLPRQQLNPTFFASNGIHVLSGWNRDAVELDPTEIDWQNVNDEHFPFKLQQEPREDNSLGRIKFMFPNPFRVYLHDTPARYLFDRKVRTFSSGCIRVERPVTLAAQLLDDPTWSRDRVRAAIHSGETQRIELTKPVPIYLLYWTAWVDDDGTTHFRNDVYRRNENIATSAARPVSSAAAMARN